MSHNPFPGPQPYRASDRDRFYGRDDLSYRLEGSILSNRSVTVYGPSGAGKSSVVQASVIPSLIEAQEIRVVRVDGWPEDKEPTAWLADAMYSDLALGERPADLSADQALLTAAQRTSRKSPRIVLVYLDQIEQLLYSSRDAAASEAFFEAVSRLIELPLRNLRVVLSLREDYLGRFRDRLRDQHRILSHGTRVGPLTVAELCGAVCQAAAAGEPPQSWDAAEMRELMMQVRVPGQAASDDAEAQAAFAQIVCRALFQQRAQGSASAAEAEQIVRSYLETTLADLGPMREAAQRLLEDHLVTSDGSRTLRTEKELLRMTSADKLSPILKALEGAAILHAEEHQGSRYFEIGHDWLARRVFEQRQEREREEEQRRRDEEQQRELEKQRVEAEARLAKERSRRRVSVAIAAVSLVGLVIAATGGVFAVVARNGAITAKLDSDKQKRIAQIQEKKATEAAARAKDERIMAGFRELSARGQQAWATKLLPEVGSPEAVRGWVETASDALATNVLRASFRGHSGPLTAALWSPPDGKRILTASTDKTARLWNADATGPVIVLKGHEAAVLAAAWSPDGKRVVTGSEDGSARLWNATGKDSIAILAGPNGHSAPIMSVAFSADGSRVLTASLDKTARLWSADGGDPQLVLKGDKSGLRSAIFHPDGKRVITASEDGDVLLWEGDAAGKFAKLAGGHGAGVLFLALSSDGKRFVTTSRDKTARIWDASGKGSPVVLKGHEGSVFHAAFSKDGKWLATASADRTARLWPADGKGKEVVLLGHTASVSAVTWGAGDKYVVTVSADRTAKLWLPDGTMLYSLGGHEAPIRSVELSPDGASILTAAADRTGASADFTARVFSTELLQQIARVRRSDSAFHTASLSADGESVAAAYEDRTARLFRGSGDGEATVFRGHEGWVANAALSADGKRVVTASFDKTARLWNSDGSGEPVVLKGHEAELRFAAFSPDGKRVATVSNDRTARIWSSDGAGQPVVLKGHEDWLTSAAWSPDGKHLVTSSLDRTAMVWSADGSGAAVPLKGHKGGVNGAVVSPDGKRVVTVSEDGTARLWSLDGSGEAIVLPGREGALLSAAWSPDGKRVATASADGTVRLWNADGKGAPVVLKAQSAVIALAFGQDGQSIRTVTAGNLPRTWMIDIGTLKKRLAAAHADCLPADVRVAYIGERPAAAHSKYAECESGHGRTASPSEGNTQ